MTAVTWENRMTLTTGETWVTWVNLLYWVTRGACVTRVIWTTKFW